MELSLKIIARIRTDFPTKFGIPRQSGLVESLKGLIVFEKEYQNPDTLRGLEGFSHIWLIWQFSESLRENWSATVRPPRLGGNTRFGVFATRSPFRPNPLGLSSVKLDRIELDSNLGPVLHVSGVDLMDNTPIYDIKPYIPYADCHTDATSGFTDAIDDTPLTVVFPEKWLAMIPADRREALRQVLSLNPKPGYQNDPARRYGFEFAGRDVRFTIDGGTLTVVEVVLL